MKIILGFLFLVVFLIANDLEIKGDIGVEYKKTSYDISIPNKTQKSLNAQLELYKQYEEYLAFIKVEVLEDKDDNTRDYTKLNEAYLKYEGEDFEVKAGRDIKFWGALEIHNLTDIYNLKNTQYDTFDKDKKLGTKGVTLTKYFENEDEISLIRNKINDIQTNFIKYSGSRDYIGALDFTFIATKNKDKNQFLNFNTMVKDDTLYKIEYSYTENKDIANYYELGAGIEHTLYGLIGQKDLGLIIEYYQSDNYNLTYQKDIFTGVRLTFNDVQSSDIVTGIIQDRDTKKEGYSFEYNTRLFDKFKTKVSYLENDYFSIIGLSVGYYF